VQPFCTDCGHWGSNANPLTTDHLRWPARTLADVDVVCRSCNSKRGRFAVTDLDPASPGSATGSGQASFYLDHGSPVIEDDLLVLTAPELGTWRVTAARWSPSSQRLLLSRV